MTDIVGTVHDSSRAMRPTILLVESHIVVRAMLAEELRIEGYAVVDLGVRGTLDGPALVRLTRAESPFLRIVALTHDAPDTELGKLLDAHFLKPVHVAELARHLRHLFVNDLARQDLA